MRSTDVQLVAEVKRYIDHILEAQKNAGSTYHKDARGLIRELHGPLVELADLDKEENTTLIDLLVGLLYAREDRTYDESLELLQDLSIALGKLRVDQ